METQPVIIQYNGHDCYYSNGKLLEGYQPQVDCPQSAFVAAFPEIDIAPICLSGSLVLLLVGFVAFRQIRKTFRR